MIALILVIFLITMARISGYNRNSKRSDKVIESSPAVHRGNLFFYKVLTHD